MAFNYLDCPCPTSTISRTLLAWTFAFALAMPAGAAISPSGDVAPTYPAGNPDPWNVGDHLIIADSANGNLTISGGSDVLSAGGTLGFSLLTSGAVTVTGSGSTWINSEDLFLGVGGTGLLSVLNSGRVENQDAFVGHISGTGQVLVSGAGSQWINSDNLVVGNNGNGSLTIQQQGLVHSKAARIGSDNASLGTVVVDGQQSVWEVADSLAIGSEDDGGAASLLLSGAGSRVYVGDAATTQGAILPLTQTALVVSDVGTAAQVSIYEGNTLENAGSALLGVGAGESGSVLVHGAGSAWSNTGNVFVGVNGTGTVTLTNGGQVTSGGTIAIGAGGTVTGIGTVIGTLSNSGVVAPGQTVGTLAVTGSYTQSASGKLRVNLAGSSAGEFSTLNASLQATLAGTLDVDLGLAGGNPFVPQLGNAFPIVSASGGITGKFAAADLPMLAAGKMWQIRYSGTSALLVVTLAGDYNDNGVVDAADYTIWRNLSGAVFDPRADGDTNGVVNIADFNIWKANFGLTAGAGSNGLVLAASVPEPATVLCCGTLLAFLAVFVRPRRC